MTEPRLHVKLSWLIAIRAIVSTALLGGAVVAQIRGPGSFPVDPFFFLIALTYAVTLVYALTVRYAVRHRWLLDLQLAGDACTVSAFIYFTGGVTSFFSVLYVLPIVAASTVQFRRGGVLVAALSALMYTGIVVEQYQAAAGLVMVSWPAPAVDDLPPLAVAQYTIALNAFGFLAVAWLSGSLAEHRRSSDERLELASTELATLQAFSQHVIDSLPSGLATTDSLRRIVTFNRAAHAITGLSPDTVVGRPLPEVLQLPSLIMETLDRGLHGAGVRRLEFTFRRPDGALVEIGFSATHLLTPSGRVGLLVTFQDVTDVKRLERAARLQQRLAAVGEMAAGIAHEIRNPLASISGSIQVMRQELGLTSEQTQLMDIVLRESERLNTTIRSFLDYARPERFLTSRFDVRRVLSETALLIRNSAERRAGHTIDLNLPADDLPYEADEGQIKQIVWNLATNGLRAMPDGGRLTLAAAFEPASGGLLITVQDEGVGIAAEALDGIFQPFQGSFARGTGLGLAIVHRIVTDYHGEIQVSSQPGRGTRVSVCLPARIEVVA
jgi:two-component system sensor histidine kinase PilS (NtrC family)